MFYISWVKYFIAFWMKLVHFFECALHCSPVLRAYEFLLWLCALIFFCDFSQHSDPLASLPLLCFFLLIIYAWWYERCNFSFVMWEKGVCCASTIFIVYSLTLTEWESSLILFMHFLYASDIPVCWPYAL